MSSKSLVVENWGTKRIKLRGVGVLIIFIVIRCLNPELVFLDDV